MISDKERREVAAKLRGLAKNRHYVDEFIAGATVGFWRGEATEGFDSDSLLEVAELIDRPMTHVDVNKHGRACCANCGCDDWCLADDNAHFCPQCGAEVAG